MPQLSSIRRMPKVLREAIEAKLDEGYTLDDVVAHVRGLGATVSRSAVGRYKKRLDAALERSRESRAVAEMLARSAGRNGLGLVLQGQAESLQDLILRAAEAVADKGVIAPKDAMLLATALDKLARAAKAGSELHKQELAEAALTIDAEGRTVPGLAGQAGHAGQKQIGLVFVEAQTVPASVEVKPEAVQG